MTILSKHVEFIVYNLLMHCNVRKYILFKIYTNIWKYFVIYRETIKTAFTKKGIYIMFTLTNTYKCTNIFIKFNSSSSYVHPSPITCYEFYQQVSLNLMCTPKTCYEFYQAVSILCALLKHATSFIDRSPSYVHSLYMLWVLSTGLP